MHLASQVQEQLETLNNPKNTLLKPSYRWQSAAIYKRGTFAFGMTEKQIQV